MDVNKNLPDCDKIIHLYDTSSLPTNLKNRTSLKRIGYPRVENYGEVQLYNYDFQSKVRHSVIDMDDPDIPDHIKDSIEFIVDVSDPNTHHLEYKLKFNSTRAKEQKELESKIRKHEAEDELDKKIESNVLIIYLDTLSRARFRHVLPKTSQWLSQFVGEDSDMKSELFQFFRYHSVYKSTRYNNNAIYYGQFDTVKDSSKNMFDYFSENGYITGMFKDGCETHVNDFDFNQSDVNHNQSSNDSSNHRNERNITLHKWDHYAGHIV